MTWLRSRALGRAGSSGHATAHCRSTSAGGLLAADATQAGMPTPSYAAPHDREPRQRRHGRPDPGHPAEVADGVLRQSAAPAGDPGVHRRVGDARGRRSRSARTRSTRSASSRCRTASSPWRPTEARTTTRPGARSAYQPHFVEEKVTALTDAAVDRRHQEARAGRQRRNAAAGKARVTSAIDAYSHLRRARTAAGGHVRAQQPRGGGGRDGEDDRVGQDLLRRPGRADRPAASRSACGRSSRTVAPVRISAPDDAAATAAGSRPTPPRGAPNTGAVLPGGVGGRPAGARGGEQRALLAARAARAAARVASRDSSSARPAYTPPSSGSTSRSTTARPSRAATNRPTETSSPIRVRGQPAVERDPGRAPAGEQPAGGQRAQVAGDAHHGRRRQRRAGRRGSRRRRVVRGGVLEVVAEADRPAPGRPPRAGGAAATRRRRRPAPRPTSLTRSLPPTRPEPSSTVTRTPPAAAASRRSAPARRRGRRCRRRRRRRGARRSGDSSNDPPDMAPTLADRDPFATSGHGTGRAGPVASHRGTTRRPSDPGSRHDQSAQRSADRRRRWSRQPLLPIAVARGVRRRQRRRRRRARDAPAAAAGE